MKRPAIFALCAALLPLAFSCTPQPEAGVEWRPAGDRIMTPWGETLDPAKGVLTEYPRPQLVREEWMNLNGLWNIEVADRDTGENPLYSGPILVPFPVESALSGVGIRVGADREMTYTRSFTIPRKWRDRRVVLNFGAVDWETRVFVNDTPVGSHTGGYTPFSIDITDALKRGDNTLTVKVWDPTNESSQPRGKQVNEPRGIWYTPVSGIWQTVWMEPVAATHISSLNIVPDIDLGTLAVIPAIAGDLVGVSVKVYEAGKLVAEASAPGGDRITVKMPSGARLWSPDDPFLYDLVVTAGSDEVKSYAGMRKFSRRQDGEGVWRLQLNNRDLFQLGPLDQGWWPDGLYTAPSDEALAFDIEKTKELGFNTIRKHVKVEPARWYYHCDRLGMIVWQDMPSGGPGPGWQQYQWYEGEEPDGKRTPESEAVYRKEWREIIDAFRTFTCIGVWVPFNESWGQFKTREITEWTQRYDPSRMVNAASGGNYFASCGDILDLHKYPAPEMFLYDPSVVNVMGEYGGIGWAIREHLWEPDRNWGYVQYDSEKAVTDEYVNFAGQLLDLVPKGFSAGIYTQTTDVEIEVNGLMTYDRKVVKLDVARVREANLRLVRSLDK
jgi:beta-galactosidase/beta-glucuronidase